MYRKVDPKTAHELMQQGYTYVDVRTVDEFADGHPAGAYNVPAFVPGPGGMTPNPEFLEVMRARFPPTTRLLLGCAVGGRSARAAELLASAGYTDLCNVEGGFNGAKGFFANTPGWRDEGLPVETDAGDRGYDALRG